MLEAGRRARRRRHGRTSCAGSRICSLRARPLPADPVSSQLARRARRPASSSSGRATRSTATTRRTRRCGSRARSGGRRASSPHELVDGGRAARRRSSAPRSPAPASSTSSSRTRGSRLRSTAIARRGRRASAAAAAEPRSASRSRWSRRTRRARSPSRPRGTAPTATRSRGCSSSRGHEVEREYYYNDAGAQMERFRASVEAAAPRRGAARGRLPRRVRRRSWRRCPATRCRRCCAGSRRRSSASASTSTRWALQSELEQRLPELLPRLDTYEKDGALWARSSAYGDEEDRVLHPLGRRRADVPRRRRRIPRRQARARLRPRDLRARRRPSRHAQLVRGDRAHARLRPGARRGAALPARAPDAGRRAERRCRSGAATSCSSTS